VGEWDGRGPCQVELNPPLSLSWSRSRVNAKNWETKGQQQRASL
jgi:hypothetical protein